MRAVIYIRLSVHRGETDPSLSPQRQEEVCRAYCLAKGWDVLEVVRDLDVSGSDKGARLARPGLDEIRELWGQIDVVVFAKLDRLARNVSDFRAFAEEAQANGAALVSVAESLDLSSPSGRFVATILAAFAEMEAATIAERVRGGVRSTRLAGRYAGGYLPWGYDSAPNPDGAGRTLVVNEDEAVILREAAERLLDGERPAAVSRDLNARGLRAKKGGQITAQALRQALTSEAILGRTVVDGRAAVNERGMPIQSFPAILSVDQHTRLRVQLAPQTERRTRGSRSLLVGLLRCHSCGGSMSTQGSTYSCKARSVGRLCDAPVHTNIKQTDEVIIGEYLARFGALAEVVEQTQTAPDPRIGEVSDAIRLATEAMREPGADVSALATVVTDLAAERDRLAERSQPKIERVRTGRTVQQAWEQWGTPTRRQMVASALAKPITVCPAHAPRRFDPNRFDLLWWSDLGEFAEQQ